MNALPEHLRRRIDEVNEMLPEGIKMDETPILPDELDKSPNTHYRESLTVWGGAFAAQMREGMLAIAIDKDAPRSTEDGQPYLLITSDAALLRDLLNAATQRGFLPKEQQ